MNVIGKILKFYSEWNTTIYVVATVILSFLSGVTQAVVKDSKSSKKKLIAKWSPPFFALITGILAILSSIDQKTKNDNKTKISDSTAKVKDSISEIYRIRLENSQNEIINIQKKVLGFSEGTNKTSDKLFKTVSGFESFPIIYLYGNKTLVPNYQDLNKFDSFHLVTFVIANSGQYPLNSVEIEIDDRDGFMWGLKWDVSKKSFLAQPNPIFTNLNTLSQHSISSIPPQSLPVEFYHTTRPLDYKSDYYFNIRWFGGYLEYHITISAKDDHSFNVIYHSEYPKLKPYQKKKIKKEILSHSFGNTIRFD